MTHTQTSPAERASASASSDYNISDDHRLMHAVFAGMVGGIVGTWAMATFQQVWNELPPEPTDPRGRRERSLRLQRAGVGAGHHAQTEPRSHHQPGPTPGEKLVDHAAEALVGHGLPRDQRERLSSVVHYAFGAAAGALYGAAAEAFPAVATGGGTLFGALVWLLADEWMIPAMGLGPRPSESPLHAHAYALGGHLAYGAALEATRRVMHLA